MAVVERVPNVSSITVEPSWTDGARRVVQCSLPTDNEPSMVRCLAAMSSMVRATTSEGLPDASVRVRRCNTTAEQRGDDVAVLKQDLYALCRVDRRRDAIARALDFFDDRLLAGDFRDCDRALRQLEVAKLSPSVLVSILGITIRAKKLECRDSFYQRALEEIARQKGKKYATELLTKYR
ncbi:MAG: hypothetical protein JNM56_00240 [Planctomycetia bacterium]|nr:hypothetical protein [Planctomycetia bacterium]